MTGKIIFLHLSDMHFGDQNETNSAKRTNTLNKLLLILKKLPPEWKPQSIAISGDIGWHGLENDYNIAESWLMELLKTLNLTANDIIPAPGNHDINLKLAAAAAVPAGHIKADELLDLDLLESVSVPFKGFEDFCKRMKIPPLTLGSKSSYLAGSRVHNGITWLVLNSAWFCREGRKEKLYIGLPHLDVITAAESWKKRDIPIIGILHHPPPCLQDEELNSYGSRRNTYDFLAGECDMILSGHVHGMLKAPDTMYQKTYLFTGGSSYSNETVRNNFSIFRLDISSGKIERRAYEWNPADGDWEHREKYSQVFSFIGEKKPGLMVEEEQDLHQRLLNGSRRHYEDLCGENGRFRHLDISDIILQKPSKKEWLDSPIKSFAGSRGGFSKEPLAAGGTLLDIIPLLWQEGCKHAVVKGDGGMGKTVSLVRLWDEFTKDYHADRPVPVFIQLNEINTVPEEKRMDFILSSISREYLDGKVSEEEILLFLRESRDVPAVVLLLDGFNEITVEKRELLLVLNHLTEQCPGLQVVITSRYDMRENFNWGHWRLLELKHLEEDQAAAYLSAMGQVLPGPGRLRGLMGNPMMLTLYAAAGRVRQNYPGTLHSRYKDRVETTGELLWNFMEAQVALLPERLAQDEKKIAIYTFLLQFFLPGLGYEMEKAGLYDFSETQLAEVMEKLCRRYAREDFFKTFTRYQEFAGDLPIGECADDMTRFKRLAAFKKMLCRELSMLVQEGDSYRFLHQHFRDFFAAVYILNELDMGKSRGDTTVLRERRLDFNIRRMLGEVEGEYRSKPYLSGKKWRIHIDKENRLYKTLESLRGKFGADVGHGVWNIVETWKEVRGELSGADLSNLDLSGVKLNGVCCSRFYPGGYLAACFDRARVHERNLFSWGHSYWVNSAVYSEDGKKILSASSDQTIKEWDVETGECLKTLAGHSGPVKSAVYSGDGKKILSPSEDQNIKEWDMATGECVKTLAGHSRTVTSAVHSRDGKILSASEDKTIKEWDADTGECVKTLAGHSSIVNSAVYSPDEKKILSASEDQTIKEWDTDTGECVRTLAGHSGGVTSAVYSRDGEKILSASSDHTIKEWDVETGECVKTLDGHSFGVTSAVYSRDNKKILSASGDNTIKEWDSETGECVKTLFRIDFFVSSAVYSPDGKKVLSASLDRTIIEWDVGTWECLKTMTGHSDYVSSAVYSSDGKKIISASWDNTIKEWDAETGKCVKTLTGHTRWVNSAVYSWDGKKILSASYDQTIKEWDAETGECVKTLTGHNSFVISAVYSRDNKKILSTSGNDIIKEWNTETGECLHTWKKGEKNELNEYDPGENEDIKLKTDGNKIQFNGKELINIPGLFIQGCSFKNLHPDSDLSEESKNLMRQYGAVF